MLLRRRTGSLEFTSFLSTDDLSMSKSYLCLFSNWVSKILTLFISSYSRASSYKRVFLLVLWLFLASLCFSASYLRRKRVNLVSTAYSIFYSNSLSFCFIFSSLYSCEFYRKVIIRPSISGILFTSTFKHCIFSSTSSKASFLFNSFITVLAKSVNVAN